MILEKIAAETRVRVEQRKQEVPLAEMKELAQRNFMESPEFPFEKALRKHPINYICEVKKASPSKGLIAKDFPYVEIAKEYEAAGAACVSVLTEPKFFLGSDTYLTEIKRAINLPVIRKDFIVDAYQIYEAKTIGADCVLLICALLSLEELKQYLGICDALGLSALVEAHDEQEVQQALAAGSRLIGVNNRDLRTFEVDLNNSIRLRKLVAENVLFVAESGIRTAADIARLKEAQVNGVLIGETLMRSSDKKGMLQQLDGRGSQA